MWYHNLADQARKDIMRLPFDLAAATRLLTALPLLTLLMLAHCTTYKPPRVIQPVINVGAYIGLQISIDRYMARRDEIYERYRTNSTITQSLQAFDDAVNQLVTWFAEPDGTTADITNLLIAANQLPPEATGLRVALTSVINVVSSHADHNKITGSLHLLFTPIDDPINQPRETP
jgi:hypothetical protein